MLDDARRVQQKTKVKNLLLTISMHRYDKNVLQYTKFGDSTKIAGEEASYPKFTVGLELRFTRFLDYFDVYLIVSIER